MTDKLPAIVERWPQIDWRGFAGLRDFVSHNYFKVDVARLYPVVVEELPSLRRAVGSEIRRIRLSPFLEVVRSKQLTIPTSESDLLDTLAMYCSEDQIPDLLAQAEREMADVPAFLKERGIPIPGFG